jgi:hypothetical protein
MGYKQKKVWHKQKKGHSATIAITLAIIVICAVVGLAFAGVQPLATYKDNVLRSFQTASQSVQIPTIAPIATLVDFETGSNIEPFPSAPRGLRTFQGLWVYLKPTSLAKANYNYKVDLFEKGKLRETGSVQWNQPEINVIDNKGCFFHLTTEEYVAYMGKDLNHIFSVSVHE